MGPAIVHLAHARPGAAAGSFGLQVGGPLLGGLLGYAIECSQGCGGMFPGMFGMVAGAAVGHLTAATLDVAVLSYEAKTTTAASALAAALSRSVARLRPTLATSPPLGKRGSRARRAALAEGR